MCALATPKNGVAEDVPFEGNPMSGNELNNSLIMTYNLKP